MLVDLLYFGIVCENCYKDFFPLCIQNNLKTSGSLQYIRWKYVLESPMNTYQEL